VTTQAVELYTRRLKPDGLLVFHISNRYFDLSQPLARIARSLGLHAAIRFDFPAPDAPMPKGARPSIVLTISPDADRIQTLLALPHWQPIQADGGKAWSDDNANPLAALR